jgi:hypothetical protein
MDLGGVRLDYRQRDVFALAFLPPITIVATILTVRVFLTLPPSSTKNKFFGLAQFSPT